MPSSIKIYCLRAASYQQINRRETVARYETFKTFVSKNLEIHPSSKQNSSVPFSINLENARHSNNICLHHRRITKSTTVSKILRQTSAVIISTKHMGWLTRFQRWNLGLPLLYDRKSSRLGDRTGKSWAREPWRHTRKTRDSGTWCIMEGSATFIPPAEQKFPRFRVKRVLG